MSSVQRGLLINVPQLGDLEILRFTQCTGTYDKSSRTIRHSVAIVTHQPRRVVGPHKGILSADWIGTAEGPGKCSVEILVRIRLKHYGVDEIAIRSDVRIT